jgi:hypothetical protein
VIELLQLVNARKHFSLSLIQPSLITIGNTMSSQSLLVFSRCPVAASTFERSSSLSFSNGLQVPVISSSHQQLNNGIPATDGQSASLSWYRPPTCGPWPDWNCCGHPQFSSCGAPSLTTGRVYNLLVRLLLGFANAVTLRTRDHMLVSHLRLGSLSGASYNSQRYGGGILGMDRT